MDNIVMIGMPGSGKSTVGAALAEKLGMTYVDADRVIEAQYGLKLSQIIEKYGDDGFRQIENEVNASLDLHRSVIAPGGSVVYGEEAMTHLREIATVVYLKLSYATIEERLGDLHARGVTLRPDQTLLDLYNERIPLYEKYAHVVVDCDGLTLDQEIKKICEDL